MNYATLFALAAVHKMAAAFLCFNFESGVWNVRNIKPLTSSTSYQAPHIKFPRSRPPYQAPYIKPPLSGPYERYEATAY